ncbi:MAG: LamG domain-containing protein [Nitrospira sp.]|nr:LamG domain-containing protein [Nitrospira sp.]
MATSDDHIKRYKELRARLLAQHFAYSRHLRVNFLSLWNWVADTPKGLGTNPSEEEELKRWNAIVHGRENPLAYSAHLVAFLSVEHALGHDKARPIIDLALEAFGQLYKFEGDFAGFPTRWDANTSARSEGITPRDRVRDFLVGPDGKYLYSIPATDPRHVPFRDPNTLRNLKTTQQAEEYEKRWVEYKELYRRSELSMDELAGLVGAYAVAFRLVDVPSTRTMIRTQANKLGDYLAQHGYMLVRPAGGFTAQGATGVLSAYEYPLVSAFRDITGTDYSSRTNFMDVLKQAGYHSILNGKIIEFQVGGFLLMLTGLPQAMIAGVLGMVQSIAGILGIPITGTLTLTGAVLVEVLNKIAEKVGGMHNVLRALAVFVNRNCFDVMSDNEAGEVAIASILKEIPSSLDRFSLWTLSLKLPSDKGGYAAYHLLPLALSAINGTDTHVGDLYRGVVASWRATPPTNNIAAEVAANPFTSALALLHSDSATDSERRAEEAKLVELLDAAYEKLGTDLPVEENTEFSQMETPLTDEDEQRAHERTNVKDLGQGELRSRGVLYYLAALALAWLYEKRRRDAGTPVETDRFPIAPASAQFAEWPAPTIPGYVVNRLDHVRQAVQVLPPTPSLVPDAEQIDLFSTRVVTAPSPPLHPVLPTPTTNFLREVQVTVGVNDGDVDTGIVLKDNDEFEISAEGQIRGTLFSGLSGPDGWDQVADGADWPLHIGLDPNVRKFALLGSLGGYFLVGSHFPRTRFLHSMSLPLYLRINKAPGDSFGEFVVTIRLWGTDFAAQVLADRPVAYYRLNESAGSNTVLDSSGHAYHGTVSATGVTLGEPGLGHGEAGALFDGAEGRIVVPNRDPLNPPRITMETVIRWNGPTAGIDKQAILGKLSYIPDAVQYGLFLKGDGRVFVQLRKKVSGPPDYMTATSLGAVASGMATHVAATYDGFVIRIYFNGVLDSTSPTTGDDIDTKADQPQLEVWLTLGNLITDAPPEWVSPFNGLIDEVAIYPRALSAERIRFHVSRP